MDSGIKNIIYEQIKTLASLETQLKQLEKRDVFLENDELRKKLENLETQINKLIENENALKQENLNLKNTVYEQFYSEKLSILKKSEEKIKIFFSKTIDDEYNRLLKLENNIIDRLKNLSLALKAHYIETEDELYKKIEILALEIQEKINKKKEEFRTIELLKDERQEYQNLVSEKLTSEQIKALAKKSNFEKFIGLNVMNTIGVILIIIGVIAAANYVQTFMTNELRALAIFVLGFIFLFAGEIVNRKKTGVFSLGVTAGGIAILYVAIAVSFFIFGVIGEITALFICVVITGITFTLSTRYDSQTILTLAILGGYMPIFSRELNREILLGLMLYFAILNLLAFFTAFRKKWTLSSFVGLALTIIGMVFIISHTASYSLEKVFSLIYIAFAWLTYVFIPLIGTYKTKTGFAKQDIILISIATFFGALILFLEIEFSVYCNILGLISFIFGLIYFGVYYFIRRKFEEEKSMAALFFISGVAFFVLFVPFELSSNWFAIFWLVQSLGFGLYGIIRENLNFKRAGAAIALICLIWFIFNDALNAWDFGVNNDFTIKYAVITLASFIILFAYNYKKAANRFSDYFKYGAIINFWFFILYAINQISDFLILSFPASLQNIYYLTLSFMGTTTLFYSILLPKIKPLLDLRVKRISTALSVIGILSIFTLNIGALSPITDLIEGQETIIMILAANILFFDSALSAYAVFRVARRAVVNRLLGSQYLPLIISAYITIISTFNLVNRFNLVLASFWVTILYAFAALLWTILGFYKRYALMRAFGLFMSFTSVIKFFIIDLSVLTQGFRILSYFALGVALIGVSFVYQYFSKRLEKNLF